jgi:hypothetical protein
VNELGFVHIPSSNVLVAFCCTRVMGQMACFYILVPIENTIALIQHIITV